jgi:zinc protease
MQPEHATLTHRLTTLENGLEVIVRTDRCSPITSVQLWCRTGSIHEGAWTGAGISHFVEHMLFKGTSRREVGEIARQVEEQGGYINAYTSFDRTVYWIDTPADATSEAIDALIDAASDAVMPEAEVAREQEVIRREFSMGNDDPHRVLSKATFANTFRTHPFRQPIIGHLETFNQITREDLLAYYHARYLPDNCFLVVVGDIDADAVIESARQSSSNWPRRAVQPVLVPSEAPQLGRRDRHEEFQTPLHHLCLAWHLPAIWHPDIPALDILATILGEGHSSRLYKEVKQRGRVAHGVHACAYTPGPLGLFLINGQCDPEKRHSLEASILTEIRKLQETEVAGEELEKACKASLCDQLHALTTMRGQASDLGGNWLVTQNPEFGRDYLVALRQVTAADLQRVAQTYLVEDKLSATSLSPKGGPCGERTDKGTSRSSRATTNNHLEKLATLDNGLRVIVRKDHRVPLATATLTFGGGLLADGTNQAGLSQLLASTILKGTATRSADEISDAIENAGGSIGASSGNNSFGVSAGLLAEDLPMALEIVADVVGNAAFPQPLVDGERDTQIARIAAELENPLTVAAWEARRRVFGSLPYALPQVGTHEIVESLQVQHLREIRERITHGRNGVLCIVGDVEPAAMIETVHDHFSALTGGTSLLGELSLPPCRPESGHYQLNLDKEQAILIVAYPSPNLLSPQRHALDLVDSACSNMASRLFTRIREKLGLCYFIGSGQLHGFTHGMFYFYVGTSPEKLELVEQELLAEIADLTASGLTVEETQRARSSVLGRHAISLQSPEAICQTMALDTLYGFGHDHHKTVPDLIRAVKEEEIRAACATTFGTHEPVIVRVHP